MCKCIEGVARWGVAGYYGPSRFSWAIQTDDIQYLDLNYHQLGGMSNDVGK